MKLNELLIENNDRLSMLINKALSLFDNPPSYEEAMNLIDMDYEDGDINAIELIDVVEILQASGYE